MEIIDIRLFIDYQIVYFFLMCRYSIFIINIINFGNDDSFPDFIDKNFSCPVHDIFVHTAKSMIRMSNLS